MFTDFRKQKDQPVYMLGTRLITLVLSFSLAFAPCTSYAQTILASPLGGLNLPQPGSTVSLSSTFHPAIIKGVRIFPDDPLRFDFIIDKGDTDFSGEDQKTEYTKLIKYFLSSLTVPEENLWVNLSPYEKDRIIPNDFGKTEMGRDLLSQDYLLKQITASLIYPEDELGKEFWDKVYAKAQALYGTTEVPVSTFNKVWIVPDKAVVYVRGESVFVTDSHLRVMLEEDYLALEHNSFSAEIGTDDLNENKTKRINELSSAVIRDVIIPELEKEVNTGKNFANLRQIYNAVILATWFKQTLKESFLGKVYIDQNKLAGIEIEDKQITNKIYEQYLKAFKSGVFDFVREDYDKTTHEVIPRKYFSGGAALNRTRVREGSSPISLKPTYDVASTHLKPGGAELLEIEPGRRRPASSRIDEIALFNRIMNEALKGLPSELADSFRSLRGAESRFYGNNGAQWMESHVRRVTIFSVRLWEFIVETYGDGLEFSPEDKHIIAIAASLHDNGKTEVDTEIVKKPGIYTDSERSAMNEHVLFGVQKVEEIFERHVSLVQKNSSFFEKVLKIIRTHHERLDGSGYPEKLTWEDVPDLIDRFLPVIDSFETMTSQRPYAGAMNPYDAIGSLKEYNKDNKMDPFILHALEQLLPYLIQDFFPDAIIPRSHTSAASPMTETKGGIDFNPNNLELQTEGDDIDFEVPLTNPSFEGVQINGLTPIIFQIRPISNIQFFSDESEEQTAEFSLSQLN